MAAQKTYNWDDIDVGNHSLDHSQHFFANTHRKHEKLQEIDILINTELNDSFQATTDLQQDNKENENLIAKVEAMEAVSPSKLETNAETAELTNIKQNSSNEILDETEKNMPAKAAILTCWSTQKPILNHVYKPNGTAPKDNINGPRTPKVYNFKDFYQRKREKAEQQRIEAERKLREFHSRPVPNFRALHERLNKRIFVHEVTEPKTPKTLQISQDTRIKKEEIRRRCLEEEISKQQQNKSQPYPPKVLLQEPFVPKKTNTTVQSRPFQLQSERRAQERKQFDAQVQRALEEKRKQEMVSGIYQLGMKNK